MVVARLLSLEGNHLREWSGVPGYTFLKFLKFRGEGKKITLISGEEEIRFILHTRYSPFGV